MKGFEIGERRRLADGARLWDLRGWSRGGPPEFTHVRCERDDGVFTDIRVGAGAPSDERDLLSRIHGQFDMIRRLSAAFAPYRSLEVSDLQFYRIAVSLERAAAGTPTFTDVELLKFERGQILTMASSADRAAAGWWLDVVSPPTPTGGTQ